MGRERRPGTVALPEDLRRPSPYSVSSPRSFDARVKFRRGLNLVGPMPDPSGARVTLGRTRRPLCRRVLPLPRRFDTLARPASLTGPRDATSWAHGDPPAA